MQYFQCDGCGRRLQSETGAMVITIRLGPHGIANGHACSDGCAPAAADALVKLALSKVLHPVDK